MRVSSIKPSENIQNKTERPELFRQKHQNPIYPDPAVNFYTMPPEDKKSSRTFAVRPNHYKTDRMMTPQERI
jgi:hypothetical protein